MSRFVIPRDLCCFSSCEHARQIASDCPQSQPSTGVAVYWYVPEAWQACAKCRKLHQAEVVAAPDKE
jgi:hypothetical protein